MADATNPSLHKGLKQRHLNMIALGGVIAGTAKPGFLPVAAAAVVVAAATMLVAPRAARARLVRRGGPLVALAIVVACIVRHDELGRAVRRRVGAVEDEVLGV